MTDSSLIIFKAIANFTNCLDEVFGEEQRSLKLYAHLINKTTIAHEKPILKHIEAFRTFCKDNRDSIEEKNHETFSNDKIIYSDRVFINVKDILKVADKDSKNIIWKHILTISALVDPAGKARQVLKETSQKNNSGTESDFLENIISKVEENVDPNANPMEAVTSIMQSGVFQELVGGMGNGLQDGSLDLGKLMGTVQNMVTNLNDKVGESGGEGMPEETMAMMNTMMSNLQAGADSSEITEGQEKTMPDLNNLMGMMGPMLGALNNANGVPDLNQNNENSTNEIERNIQRQLEQAKKSGELSNNITPIIEEEN
tara:strand:- start:351 stop:1292 length:942 start_codon:yes stop_codon:yes gene_type:complete